MKNFVIALGLIFNIIKSSTSVQIILEQHKQSHQILGYYSFLILFSLMFSNRLHCYTPRRVNSSLWFSENALAREMHFLPHPLEPNGYIQIAFIEYLASTKARRHLLRSHITCCIVMVAHTSILCVHCATKCTSAWKILYGDIVYRKFQM